MSIKVTIRSSGNLADELRKKSKVMLLDLHAGLTQMSPVDTGDFRNEWTVDTNAMTIENHKEYAEALANGHSPQAPAGWIEAEIDRVTKL